MTIENEISAQTNNNSELKEKEEKLVKAKRNAEMKRMLNFVKYPVLTEKTANLLLNKRQYAFDVDKRLTKTQIKALFEDIFNVDVIGVNTHIPPRKTVRVGLARGYRPSFKRAIITLKENQTIKYNFYTPSEASKAAE